jgi:carbamate kinase
MKELPNKPGLYRRVVPSPKPLQIYPADLAVIQDAYQRIYTIVAAGGGGVPVLADGTAVEAVIDKDLASALLCREMAAAELIISTGVRYVAHNYGQADQQDIAYYWAKHALANLLTGQYPAGQMGETIEAAINALRFGVNQVLITEPSAHWSLDEGTVITRGFDLEKRIERLLLGPPLRDELQRWLIA